jgi:ribosomal protein S18 acetylase RimI-like enzyme
MPAAVLGASSCSGQLTRRLTVRERNVNAIALYKSLGFEVEGLHRNAVRIEGQYENLYSMALVRG